MFDTRTRAPAQTTRFCYYTRDIGIMGYFDGIYYIYKSFYKIIIINMFINHLLAWQHVTCMSYRNPFRRRTNTS